MTRRTSGPLVVATIVLFAQSVGTAQVAMNGVCEKVSCVELTAAQLPEGATGGVRLAIRNLAVANILSQLDIDGDGVPDRSPDTDGDGLPDNWEVGGIEALTAGGQQTDRVVFFPAPSAIVPGTPPTPIFTRLAVATSALNPDTDGDGLSDFVEVFGLKFIDENGNGLLDPNLEWVDSSGDGLPSPGEFPVDNSRSFGLLHDFDGFVFTDPTNQDTDGDGLNDSEDNDPLVNLRAFGNSALFIVRFNPDEVENDVDIDGLGNAMDMGNDLVTADGANPGDIPDDIQAIDNPANVGDLISLFRQDLQAAGVVPEAAIEDLLGADWDGNGLWRITDVRTWHIVIDDTDTPPPAEFVVGTHELYATQTLDDLLTTFNGGDDPVANPPLDRYAARGIGMGWQDVLQPTGGSSNFIPDPHVWAILYSWRMPGFDIDGDGFIGVPNLAATAASPTDPEKASVALRGDRLISNADDTDVPFDDRIRIGGSSGGTDTGEFQLDGRIEAPNNFPVLPTPATCGAISLGMLLLMFVGMVGLASNRSKRR